LTKEPIAYIREKTTSSIDVLGKLVISMQKPENRSLSLILPKISSKWI
jgi:hypothetical protein